MNKKLKIALAATIILSAGVTSVSAFAASDNRNDHSESSYNDTWESGRQNHLDEQVQLGNLTQEEANEMNERMDNNQGSCHGDNDGFMNRMHNNMRSTHRGMMGY